MDALLNPKPLNDRLRDTVRRYQRAGRRLNAWRLKKRPYVSSRRSAQAMIDPELRAVGSRWTDIFGLGRVSDTRKNLRRALRPGAAGRSDRGLLRPSPRRLCNLGSCRSRRFRSCPKYALVPATPLGRLRGGSATARKGYGRFLLADALYRAARSEIASFAVIVDAKDENARRYYERESFLSFPDEPMKLFRPIADIRQLFSDSGD